MLINLAKRIAAHALRLYTLPYKKKHLSKGKYVIKKFKLGNRFQYGIHEVVPENAIVFTFGIGDDVAFEESFLDAYKNSVIYGFDPTPRAVQYVKRLEETGRFHFFPIGLSDYNGEATFYMPRNQFISCSTIKRDELGGEGYEIQVPMKSLQTLMNEINVKEIDILKMDIEGEEFRVIPNIFENGIFPSQILIEIHERFFDNPLACLKSLIKVFEDNGYAMVYISDSSEEFTFLKIES